MGATVVENKRMKSDPKGNGARKASPARPVDHVMSVRRTANTKARQHCCQRASVMISISQFERKSGGWQSARAVVNNFVFVQSRSCSAMMSRIGHRPPMARQADIWHGPP